ncbi:phage tail tip lysozyme [Fructobacillus evanidus]|uniref:Surface antigen n=1 Tax=Fructobacillus evanidus TaxID=3064281 RepID=A0ABM9MWV4_9LACO|nr:Surface antigen [Fructobacillus sp. LMG 32999]CAK1245853.1 Surface antigen [Fructobacillus sp. LMG 32999]
MRIDPEKLHEHDGMGHRAARKHTKKAYKKARKSYKQAFKQKQKSNGLDTANRTLADEKAEVLTLKKQFKHHRKLDNTSLRNRTGRTIKAGVKGTVKGRARGGLYQKLQEDDLLAQHVQASNTINQARTYGRTVKTGSRLLGKTAGNVGIGTYHVLNRSKNAVMGRGFYKTPYEQQWFGSRKRLGDFGRSVKKKSQRQIRRFAGRFKKTTRVSRFLGKGVKKGVKWLNPFSLKFKILVGILVCLPLLLAFMVGAINQPGLKQDNHEINDTWLYMTQLDAQKSDDQHQYYTDWAPFMFYDNELFDDFNVHDQKQGLQLPFGVIKYQDVLAKQWEAVHVKDTEKTVDELMSGNKVATEDDLHNPWILKDSEQQDVKLSRDEIGFNVLGNQLENLTDDGNVVISRRLGYEKQNGRVVKNDWTTIDVAKGTMLKVPLAGSVHFVNDHTVQITQDQAVLTIDGVDLSRLHQGADLNVGDLLGNTLDDHIHLQYRLFDDLEKQWFDANPGFYFKRVRYTQFTTTTDDNFDPSKDKAQNAQKVYDQLTKMGYKKAGIAALLGNFDVESSINPKRAEGDYLKAPVGKYDGSYDRDDWLNIGGPQIYDGRFANIIHRGLGLGQWTDVAPGPGGRHTALVDYAKTQNKKWYDLDLQIDFLVNHDGGHSDIAKAILSSDSQDVKDLTEQFLAQWEGNPGNKVQERANAALNWYQYLGKTKAQEKQDADEKRGNDIAKEYGGNQST